MKPITIKPCQQLRGTVELPGDKSISHRAAILAALAKGTTQVKNFLFSDDCLVTIEVLRALGVKVNLNKKHHEVTIVSSGILHTPKFALHMGESGTSARMLLGVLVGQKFKTKVTGEPSLSSRPMARVIQPLRLMGAKIRAQKTRGEEFLPLEVYPSTLYGIQWKQKIPSAQVKSAILLAGLYAQGETIIVEPTISRDHTERMLRFFGGQIKIEPNKIRIRKSTLISPGVICIPGDISSAMFFIAACLLIRKSKILIKSVGINPTRMGAINVLRRMGGSIKIKNKLASFEPRADLEVMSSDLQATIIRREEIPALIDELPILMVVASLAKGKTLIEGAEELRVKETDRIHSMCSNLMKLGVNIRVKSLKNKESIEIFGTKTLKGANLNSFGDHRTAMSLYVAALTAHGFSFLDDISCVTKSFPRFLTTFKHLFD